MNKSYEEDLKYKRQGIYARYAIKTCKNLCFWKRNKIGSYIVKSIRGFKREKIQVLL